MTPGATTVVTITNLRQIPAITIVKSGTLNDDDGTQGLSAGDTITYRFTVTNTGKVTLSNVDVTDTVGGVTVTGSPIASLAPGASDSTSYTGSYTVTQADIDAGSFFNTATTTGDCSDGTVDCATDSGDETITFTNPAVEILKTGTFNDEDGDGFAAAGETVTYPYQVTNTGDVALTDVTVTDVFDSPADGAHLGDIACAADDNDHVIDVMDPGVDVDCTATYTLSQADVDNRDIANTATATGSGPSGEPITDTDDELVILPPDADLAIVKTASIEQVGAGGAFDWILDVTSGGPATARDVTVTDVVSSALTVTGVTSSDFTCSNTGNTVTCAAASMAVGATGRVTIAVSVASDAGDGSIENVATVESPTPDSDLTNNHDETSVVIVAQLPPTAAPPTIGPPLSTLPKSGFGVTGRLLPAAIVVILLGAGAVAITRRRRNELPTS